MNSFSGGGDSDDGAEYYKVNDFSALATLDVCMLMISIAHYIDNQGRELIASFTAAYTNPAPGIDNLYKICYIPSIANIDFNVNREDTFYDVFRKSLTYMELNISPEEIKIAFDTLFTPITKEEFYDLNNI